MILNARNEKININGFDCDYLSFGRGKDVLIMLPEISCPTLIIGADQDKVLGAEASRELHDRIPGSRLYMYEGYSHGVYEQAPDFNARVLRYLMWQKIHTTA